MQQNKKYVRHVYTPVGFPGLITTRPRGTQSFRALSNDRCSSTTSKPHWLSSSR